ncbi:hypothetical protein LTS18_008840 [Coniosporium uncinatum]|uniref:Uncharacterized protein n=1 Tax=Coniosporium uncinatum TaxID=93489 RepID=A0ACC3D186_9PEZI|nr:hypothetical protein LTS18_008840 [Coniosporium uncinatum]
MKREIERFEGKDGFERYLSFLAESHRHYELSVTHVLKKNFTSLWSMMRLSFLVHLFELHPFESIYARAAKYFWTERLRRVFTFGSMYMGMSPFDAPGTYSLLQYTELAEGIWYPRGGFHKVIEALVNIGERLGVQYRFNAPVSRITHEHGRATGVELQSGVTLTADIVICNADLVYAYNNLFLSSASTQPSKSDILAQSTTQSPYAKSLAERPASCSSISFYWSLSQTVPQLSAHNIFLAESYKKSFDSIFKKHLIPEQPSFYVNVPSRIDPSAAPPDRDAIVVLVPVGHLLTDAGTDSTHAGTPANKEGKQDWNAMVDLARKTILATIEARTGTSLAPLITHEEVNTPASWRERFNLDRGAILGLSHSFFNVLCFRPSTRHQYEGMGNGASSLLSWSSWKSLLGLGGGLRDLYFVGASTHPGTGVPICLAGGKVTSEQILKDYGITPPWAAANGQGQQGREAQGGGSILGGSDALVAGQKSGGEGIDLVQRGAKLTGLEVLGYAVSFLIALLVTVWLAGRK